MFGGRRRGGGGFYNDGCDSCVRYFGTEQSPTRNWIPLKKTLWQSLDIRFNYKNAIRLAIAFAVLLMLAWLLK